MKPNFARLHGWKGLLRQSCQRTVQVEQNTAYSSGNRCIIRKPQIATRFLSSVVAHRRTTPFVWLCSHLARYILPLSSSPTNHDRRGSLSLHRTKKLTKTTYLDSIVSEDRDSNQLQSTAINQLILLVDRTLFVPIENENENEKPIEHCLYFRY